MFTYQDYIGAIMLIAMAARGLPAKMIKDFIPVLQECKERQTQSIADNGTGEPDSDTIQWMCNAINGVCEANNWPHACVPDSIKVAGPFGSMKEAQAAASVLH